MWLFSSFSFLPFFPIVSSEPNIVFARNQTFNSLHESASLSSAFEYSLTPAQYR